MSEQEVIAEATDEGRQLPGAVLRQARETQGLTLGEVAGALKFSTRQIEALEADNFELLQGKTFLRGFIRAYARMLRLQPETLLAMLEAQQSPVLPPAEQIVPPDNMGETDPVPFYRRHSRKLLIIFSIALALAGVVRFYNDEPASTGRSANIAQPITVPLPVTQNVVQPGDPLSATTAVPVTGAVVQPVSPRTLNFEFSDLSWLEVKDASGQVLLTGEFPAGQKQTATGKPPYQLWIGRASAVKVTIGDQAVDLQPYTRDDVARLTLGQ